MADPPALASTLAIGEAPAAAMAMTYVAMADSIALAMQNAVSAQQRGQLIAGAATTQVVAMIIAAGAAAA